MSLKMKHYGPLCKGVWKGTFEGLRGFYFFGVVSKEKVLGGYATLSTQIELESDTYKVFYTKLDLEMTELSHCVIPQNLVKWSDEE